VWIGLGNPGLAYERTRHNFGYAVIDFFLKKFGERRKWENRNAKVWHVSFHKHEIVMVKPATFMNHSGMAVAQIVEKLETTPAEVVVFHDDVDLDIGRTKLKWKGGDAGHKGIRSIITYLRTDAFFRVRMGIGRPPEGLDVSDYVLSPFTSREWEIALETMGRIAEGMELWADQGTTYALNHLNRWN